LGAHHVPDHSRPLVPQMAEAGLKAPGFVFSTTHTDSHLPAIAEMIAPQGRFALIDDPGAIDISPFKRKAVSIHWEYMFTRSFFQTPDMDRQGHILKELAGMVDSGIVHTTLTERFGGINAQNLMHAHRQIESGRVRGKIVLEGF